MARANTATKGEVNVIRKPDRIGEASRQIRSIARNTVETKAERFSDIRVRRS